MDRKNRMLILRFSALGDVAMTIPFVYILAETYPNLIIDYVTSSFFGKLFINSPENLHVHTVNLKKDFKGFTGIIRLFHYLLRFNPYYVADLHNVGKTWILDILFKITGRKVAMLNKMRLTRHYVINSHIPHSSILGRISKVFANLSFPIKTRDFSINIPSPLIRNNQRAVGIAPFARYSNKTYPLDLMERVICLLCNKGINIYLFGGNGNEKEILERIANKYSGCHSIAGTYTLSEELGIMKEMDLMVSMDSANHHLASLVGTRVISIWGATTPICGFMAYGQNEQDVIQLDICCQPCSIAGSNRCKKGDFECLNMISPHVIVNKIEETLNSLHLNNKNE